MKTLRIFISSPGDVAEERDKAKQVIAALQQLYGDRVQLLPVLWENLPLCADASFQQGIDLVLTGPHSIDIAVFILWSRLGTPLGPPPKPDGTPYRSGTEREFDLMLAVRRQSNGQRPHILVYTRRDDEGWNATLDAKKSNNVLKDLIEQRELAHNFITEVFHDEQGHNIRAYHSYHEPVTFAQRLHTHLKQLLDTLLPASRTAVTWSEAPYRSLEAFDIRHAPIFCGRDEETCDLLQRLRDQQRSGTAFVCIVGASGAGKSSLARAGVAATLLQRSFDDGVKEWRAAVFLPSLMSGDLCLSLVRTLAEPLPELRAGPGGLERLAKSLEDGNYEAAGILIETAFKTACDKLGGPLRLLLVLDQMEELWTDRGITTDQRERFLEAIEAIASSVHLSVLATLRSDFYPQAQISQAFLRMKGERGHFDLIPPGPAALHELIVQPAHRAGLRFERDASNGRTLDQRILEDAVRDPSALPLLQYALAELHERRDEKQRLLTFAAYEDMGGVEGALGRRAALTFDGLPADAQAALNELLPLLASVDIAGEQSAVRRRAPLAELTDLSTTSPRTVLVKALVSARFITTDNDTPSGTPIATLAHEALLRRWNRISAWIEVNREFLRMRSQVEQSQKRWKTSCRECSLLLAVGLPLDEGRRLLVEAPHLLSVATKDYIQESISQYLVTAISTGNDLLLCSKDVEDNHSEVWHNVIFQAFVSESPVNRRNVAILLASRSAPEYLEEIINLLVLDPDDSVRQAAAQSLVLNGSQSAYERVREFRGESVGSQITRAVRGALARLLAASDIQPKRPHFADWFSEQDPKLKQPVRLLSYWLRLKNSLPTFLFVLVPSAVFAVAGAASVKWLPSAFNYSCVQATASLGMGIFHAAPSGIILGGGIVFGLTLYRIVFGREYDRVSTFRPLPAIVFGAVFGLLAGIICVLMISSIYYPGGLQIMGWTSQSTRPEISKLLADLFFSNRCGLAFPLTSTGLGIAFALTTNGLRASRQWPEFLNRQSAISSINQLGRIVTGIIRVSLPFALPIPILVALFSCLALGVMNSANKDPEWTLPSLTTFRGGFDDPDIKTNAMIEINELARQESEAAEMAESQPNKRESWNARKINASNEKREKEAKMRNDLDAKLRTWKTSLGGRALGLFGDCLAKIVGGYFCIVGMGLGIVVLRHGVKIEPKKV